MKRFYLFLISIIFLGSVTIISQPAPPENLTATQEFAWNHTFVKLNWTAPSTMVRFNVYKKDGPLSDTASFHRIFTGLRYHSFNDGNVFPGMTYSYYVTATNMQGESQPSIPVEITLNGGGGGGNANVSGVITNEVTNLPIRCADANFFATTGWGMGFHARTDSNGVFNINLPVGTYYLKTEAMGYIREFYDNVLTFQEATPITITEGVAVNFNIALAPYVPPVMYHISGVLKDSLDNPLRGSVKAYKVRFNSYYYCSAGVRTDSLGNYSLPVRDGDTLIVFATPMSRDYFPEFWDDKHTMAEADRIVIAGADVTNINFVLSHKPVYQNGIAGVVADTLGAGVESFVFAFPKDQPHHHHAFRYAVQTDSLGAYSFSNLVPGKYVLFAHPREGYMPTFFRYDGAQTLNWRDADSVMVDETSLVTGINFTVRPFEPLGEGIVSGTITDNTGLPLKAAFVYVLNFNGDISGYGITDANGKYYVNGLTAGTYTLTTDLLDYNSGNAQINIDYLNNLTQTVNLTLVPESVTDVKENPEVVKNYELYQNYPNPFNPSTTIKFSLAEKSNVKLTVYNILGVQVAQVLNDVKDAGIHQVTFDGSNLASGVYFYKLETGKFTATKKLTLLK